MLKLLAGCKYSDYVSLESNQECFFIRVRGSVFDTVSVIHMSKDMKS